MAKAVANLPHDMRIALDVTPCTTGVTGVARYSWELWRGLQSSADVLAFAVGRGPFEPPAGTRRVTVPRRFLQPLAARVRRPRVEDLVGPVDVAHCLDLAPLPSRAPLVMTAHDLLALERPDLHSSRQTADQRRQLGAFGRADLVLANSHVTGETLVRHGVPAERVRVVPLGVRPAPGAAPHPGRYLLAVGELAARKNLPLLVRAFRRARLPADVELWLVGPDGHDSGSVTSLLGDRVRGLGRVDDAELQALYAGALLFCFPSHAEGFGLPVLEAMAAGAPVVASDLPVLREVAGAAARFAGPSDEDAWVTALEDLVHDAAERDVLVEAGRTRAAAFTWERTVRETLAAYESVVR